jgi:hypothetical protein
MVCQEKKFNKKTIKGYGSTATIGHDDRFLFNNPRVLY